MSLLKISVVGLMLYGSIAYADTNDLHIGDSTTQIAFPSKIDYHSIKLSDFSRSPYQARVKIVNNLNSGFIYQIWCTWEYQDASGNKLPDGRTVIPNLRILPGNAYIVFSDQYNCVTHFRCAVTFRLFDNSTPTFIKELPPLNGECLLTADVDVP